MLSPRILAARIRQGLRAAAFMPVDRILSQAKAEATTLTLRNDVPQGSHVPADLKDEKGRFFGNGYRISGRMLTDDLLRGSPTPTGVCLLASLPVLSMSTLVLTNALGQFGAAVGCGAILTALWALNEAVQRKWVLIAAVMGIGIPVALSQGLLQKVTQAVGLLGGGGISLLGPAGAALLVSTGMVWFFSRDRRAAKRFLTWCLGLGFAYFVVSALLPRALQPIFWLGVGALPAVMYTREQTRSRALRLAYQGQMATAESTGKLRDTHIQSRLDQVENALNDLSTFVQLGVTKGVFTELHDGYAPDEGLPFGLTHNDFAQHLVVFGASGSGKTGCVLRPILWSVIEDRAISIGLVVMDGKGVLGAEVVGKGLRPYTFLEPSTGIALGLIEGLRPQAVIETLRDTRPGGQADDTGGESGNFFVAASEGLLRCASIIQEALVVASKSATEHGALSRDWHWSIWDLDRMVQMIEEAGTKYEGSAFARLFLPGGLIHDHGSDTHVRTVLFTTAYEYVRDSWPLKDSKLRGSIIETAKQWYAPLLSDELLLPWAKAETGYDVTRCLQGEWLGVCLPTERYGAAGRIVQAMVKRRIFQSILDRAGNWESAPGEVPVLFVVDEAQNLVTKADLDFSDKSRSLGGRLCYATQSFESFQAAFEKNEALTTKFLGNFGSAVCFEASFRTYKWLSEDKLGQVQAFVSNSTGGGIDFRFTAQLALSSPLLDLNHPMRNEMRALVRQGAGSVDESLLRRRRGSNSDTNNEELFDRPESMDDSTLAGLAIQPVVSGSWKTRPLLEPQEWAMYTKGKGVAIAQVKRGGFARRDVIQTRYLKNLSSDVSPLNVPQ